MFQYGEVIKHNRFMDVAVRVLYIDKKENGDICVDGVWINQGQVKSYYMMPANFVIKQDQIENWLKCENPNSEFYRNEKWSKL